jgi:hypothetical protein
MLWRRVTGVLLELRYQLRELPAVTRLLGLLDVAGHLSPARTHVALAEPRDDRRQLQTDLRRRICPVEFFGTDVRRIHQEPRLPFGFLQERRLTKDGGNPRIRAIRRLGRRSDERWLADDQGEELLAQEVRRLRRHR